MVTVVFVQFGVVSGGFVAGSQSFIDVTTKGLCAELPGVSLFSGISVCEKFFTPTELSGLAAGGGGMIGVSVLVAFKPFASVILYVMGVLAPVVAFPAAENVTTPDARFNVYVPVAARPRPA
mgnify:CR=1 FL=1